MDFDSVSRFEVLRRLQNQTLNIYGLHAAFMNWAFKVNPFVDQAREDVLAMLTSRFPDHPKLRKLLASDFGLFGASWWPMASYETLMVATYLCLWLFMWDDELDSDAGIVADNFDLGQEYRAETFEFVRNRLGLDGSQTLLTNRNEVINSFDYIGDALRQSCSIKQRELFLEEFRFYMDKSEIEQRFRLSENLVTIEEFLQFRLGTSAVRVVLSINEFCNGTALPRYVTEDPDFQAIWHFTNVNICNVNDLLSIKKEIAQGSAESLVPILYAKFGSAQKAVDHVMDTVRVTIAELEATAKRLLMRYSLNSSISRDLELFIAGCKYYCTGNLHWSMSTGRYEVFQELDINHITLILGDALPKI